MTPEDAHPFYSFPDKLNVLDATYYKVRIDGTVRDCATLKAIGIRRDDGKRIILFPRQTIN
jgi:hypothetical protein